MKRMTIPALLAAGALAVALAGCSGSQPITEDNLKGLWDLEPQSDLGFQAYVQFEDESYAELLVADSWLEGSWNISNNGNEATITLDGEEAPAKLSYNNGKLTMGKADGSKLVFVKDSDANATIDDKMTYGDEDYIDMDEMGLEESGASANAQSGSQAASGEGASATTSEADIDAEAEEEIQVFADDIPPITVADDDKVTIVINGKGKDSTEDPGYRMLVTNKTGKAIFVMADDTFKVGGKDVESGFIDTIEPGQTYETFMYFDHEELGGGAELLNGVDGVIYVGDDDTGDEIAKYPVHID